MLPGILGYGEGKRQRNNLAVMELSSLTSYPVLASRDSISEASMGSRRASEDADCSGILSTGKEEPASEEWKAATVEVSVLAVYYTDLF